MEHQVNLKRKDLGNKMGRGYEDGEDDGVHILRV